MKCWGQTERFVVGRYWNLTEAIHLTNRLFPNILYTMLYVVHFLPFYYIEFLFSDRFFIRLFSLAEVSKIHLSLIFLYGVIVFSSYFDPNFAFLELF